MSPPLTPQQQKIVDSWNLHNDDDISTERLLAMVGDDCNCGVSEIVDALVLAKILEKTNGR